MSFRDAVHFFIFHTTRYLSPMLVATEWVFVITGALLIAWSPFGSDRSLRRIRGACRSLANRKNLAMVICGLFPVIVRLAMLGFAPVPDPSIHDEFSHLLLADTLAHGRLTNPTHPMWMHFESIHIIQQPTYNSMYPPGQGGILALGQVLFHEPWAGVVISVGLMFAAMCWMFQGWLPPVWALVGTMLAVLKIGVVGMWMNSYLGGPLAGVGGALLLGGAVRFKRQGFRALHGFLAGIGLVILMNTRPFEGAVLTLAVLAYLSPVLMRTMHRDRELLLRRVILPAGAVLFCGFVFLGYYSWRVTGSPVVMPYQVNRNTYGWPENLAFLAPKIVEIRHQVIRDMYAKEVGNRRAYASFVSAVDNLNTRVFDNWTFFLGPALTVPLLFLPRVIRDRRTRALTVFLAVIAVLNLFQLVLYPFHLGPVVPVIYAIVAQALRHMYVSLSRARHLRGVYLAVVLPLCVILVGAMKQEAVELGIPMSYWEYAQEPHRDARAQKEQWLQSQPGKHLVIVRYAKFHNPNQEWVYNKADIDGQKIVWAREMDAASDGHLLEYFGDRKAWLLQADQYPPRLVRYEEHSEVKNKEKENLVCNSCEGLAGRE
jgi:hypothetical protein